MKARYRIWHLPVLSFYSKRLYRDVSFRWKGTNLGYLCLLLALCLFPSAYCASRYTMKFIDRLASVVLMQLPPMHCSSGKLTVDAPQPCSIIDGNKTLLVIDTTGRVGNLKKADALALLTKTEIEIARKDQPPFKQSLSKWGDFSLTPKIMASIINRTRELFGPIFYGVAYVSSVILFTLTTLLFGGLAVLFAALQHRKINYAAGVRLSVIALTPPTILGGSLAILNHSVPFVLYILLALTYLYMVVGSARKMQNGILYLDGEPVGN